MPELAVAIMAAVAAYLVLGEPVVGKYLFDKLRAPGKADPQARSRFYRTIILLEWALTGLVALGLWLDRTPLAVAGIRPVRADVIDFLTGIAIPLVILPVGLFLMIRYVPKVRDVYARRMEPLAPMLPKGGLERLQMALASVTAGICEEFLFRGFLLYFIGRSLPAVPLWGALVITSLVFGFAHWYQGRSGVLTTGLVGAGLGIIYYATGSLYPSMALHALMDLNSVAVAWALTAGGARVESGAGATRQG